MSKFTEEVKQLPGNHRTNVFALLIVKLSGYATELVQDKLIIKSLLSEIKALFHNHDQRFAILSFILKQNLGQYPDLSPSLHFFLKDVIESLNDETFHLYFEKTSFLQSGGGCRLQKIFESQVAIHLLLNPSQGMWTSVNQISDTIISLLECYKTAIGNTGFLLNLGPKEEGSEIPYLPLAFGRFPHTPSVDEVIAVLKDKRNLTTVMLIHFMFMRDVSPYLKQPVSLEAIASYGGDFCSYLREAKDRDPSEFFWNYLKYAPHLYTDRGRGKFVCIPSKHMGIARLSEDRAEFPSTDSPWFPDCLCQRVDPFSPYVHSLIQQDIPFVSGPSGMTSIFCGAMLMLGQWSRIEEQKYYLLAVMAFMTSGGLHSIHEVLTIPHVRLGLLPGYRAFGPDVGNYHHFFSLFNQDDVFTDNMNEAWRATIDWISRRYPHLIQIEPVPAAKEKSAMTTDISMPKPSNRGVWKCSIQ